jgi:hypothetical protein
MKLTNRQEQRLSVPLPHLPRTLLQNTDRLTYILLIIRYEYSLGFGRPVTSMRGGNTRACPIFKGGRHGPLFDTLVFAAMKMPRQTQGESR